MKKSSCWLPLGLFLILLTSLSLAQSSPTLPSPPDGGVREAYSDSGANQVLISILIPSFRDAPFTAIVNTDWTRYLGDGGTIRLVNHRAIARDSAGRIFQERRGLVPDDGKNVSPLTQIEISNPVSHDLYICVLQALTCQVEILTLPQSTRGSGDLTVDKELGIEDLGKQFIDGLEVVGRRQTMKIPIGAIGNDRPLVGQREFWYSSQLGVNLISKRQDPRFGIQNFVLSDVVLGEPDPKLFQLPPGVKVIDLRKPPEAPSGQAPVPH